MLDAKGFEGTPEVSRLRDELTGTLIGLARATEGNEFLVTDSTAAVTVEGLFALSDAADFDGDGLHALVEKADREKRKLVPDCYNCVSSCGRTDNYDMRRLWTAEEDTRSLKLQILRGIQNLAADVYRAAKLGCREDAVHNFLYKGLFAIGMDDWGREELLPILQELEEIKDKANSSL